MQVKKILLSTAAIAGSLVAAAPPQARSICSDGCLKATQLTECTPAWISAMKDCMVCTKFFVDPLEKCNTTTGRATIETVPNPTGMMTIQTVPNPVTRRAAPTGTSTSFCDQTCNLQTIDSTMTKCSDEWKASMENCIKDGCVAFIVDPIKSCEAGTSSIKTFWPRATGSPSTTMSAPLSIGTGSSSCSACTEMHHLPLCSTASFEAIDRCRHSPCSKAVEFLPRIECPPKVSKRSIPTGVSLRLGTGTAVSTASSSTGTGVSNGCLACDVLRHTGLCAPEYHKLWQACRASPCSAKAINFPQAIACPRPVS